MLFVMPTTMGGWVDVTKSVYDILNYNKSSFLNKIYRVSKYMVVSRVKKKIYRMRCIENVKQDFCANEYKMFYLQKNYFQLMKYNNK
jgi:hypothetical protein